MHYGLKLIVGMWHYFSSTMSCYFPPEEDCYPAPNGIRHWHGSAHRPVPIFSLRRSAVDIRDAPIGIADIFFPTLAQQVTQCMPDQGQGGRDWSSRRAFLGLMGLVRSNQRESLASMLQRQWDLGLFPDFARPPPISRFSQVRHLQRVEDCQAAWMLARDHAAGQIPHPGNGRRWNAMDGSWPVTSRSRSSTNRWTVPSRSALPQAIVVTAWEVRNRMPVGFCVLSGSQGERASIDELLPHLRLGDVAMVDRGFPCERLFGHFIAHAVDILARMTAGTSAWAETSAFLASTETDLVLPVEVVDPDGTPCQVPI